ncbi:MAG: caspase family protein [Oscillatoriophycideae cyanobacterium NC_groundwater_1537_Pr4_S-0.65um_50_18]|nr:caspase family protein [Oscillatoriophycideae cyanobacterium NC_groundwater_1537_Pr4_S-0.65um_50_18]
MELPVQLFNNLIISNAQTPPSTGRPGGRSDAGSRGYEVDESSSTSDSKPLSSNFHALLIGIDGYAPSPIWRSLRGAVRDINLVADYLERSLQLESHQVVKLLSPNPEVSDLQVPSEQLPTYANIVKQFQTLIYQAKPGDQVYIHYSGHGTQAATVYPELNNKGQYDEGLVPCDFASSGYYLRDVELAFLLKQMSQKGLNVTLVLDSCNSGSATRGDYEVRGGTDPNPGASGSLVAERDTLVANWETLVGNNQAAFGVPPTNEYVLLAACRSTEFAFEYAVKDAERHGALTYWMIDTLKSCGKNLSFQALHDRLLAKVQSQFPKQIPILIGDGKRSVFGSNLKIQPYTIKVMDVNASQNTVILNAGIAQGVLRGSRFSIYPFNPQNFTDPNLVLAVVEVTQIEAVTATAKVLLPEEGGILLSKPLDALLELGSPALPLSAPVELARTVRLFAEKPAGDGEAELPAKFATQQIEALDCIRQVLKTEGKGWVMELSAEPGTQSGREADFQVAVARDGTYEICLGTPIENLRPKLPIHHAASPQRVVARLIHLTKYQSVTALDNPTAPQLTEKLQFELLDATFQPFANPQQPVIKAGDIVNLRITNHTPHDLNIAVLDLEPTWEISQLPLLGLEGAFHTLLKGDTLDQKLVMSLPEDQNYLEAQETLKLFATKGAADYRWLTLPPLDQTNSTKGNRLRNANPFSQLLQAIGDDESNTRITRTRAVRIPPNAEAEWTTKQIHLTIQRSK